MTKEIVTIRATDAVRKLAGTASSIQDACNSRAVANFLVEVQGHFLQSPAKTGQKYCGTDMAAQNPISIAVLNKLNHLAGLEQSRTDCFVAILDLEDGRDVDWEIDFS